MSGIMIEVEVKVRADHSKIRPVLMEMGGRVKSGGLKNSQMSILQLPTAILQRPMRLSGYALWEDILC